MTKIKRNDPCPCGSGKKYKFCCHDNDTVSQTHLVNQELDRLHSEFIAVMMSDYAEEIDAVADERELTSDADEETIDIYHTGLGLWIPFHVPALQEDNRTIHADFFWQNSHRMSTPAQELFKAWGDCMPSVYTVQGINHEHRILQIEASRNKKQYQVPFNPDEDFTQAKLLIGTLIPFADQYSFFFTILKLYEREPEDVASLLDTYIRKSGGLEIHYPDFLADALLSGQEERDWKRPVHQEVARMFADNMTANNRSEDMLFQGVKLWQRFVDKIEPAPKTPYGYAAALEYLVRKDLHQEKGVTQSQLAEDYNCTSDSISVNYRKLVEERDELSFKTKQPQKGRSVRN